MTFYISNVVSLDDSYVTEEDVFVTIIITEEGRTSANCCSKPILSLYQTFTMDLVLVITHVFTYNYLLRTTTRGWITLTKNSLFFSGH